MELKCKYRLYICYRTEQTIFYLSMHFVTILNTGHIRYNKRKAKGEHIRYEDQQK